MNATDDQSTPGLGPVVVNGIQDVSAFLLESDLGNRPVREEFYQGSGACLFLCRRDADVDFWQFGDPQSWSYYS